MKIAHYMRLENSGLAHTTMELVEEEARQGHSVSLRESSTDRLLYGTNGVPEVQCVHSQLPPSAYHDGIPKFMWCHGEPLGSVGNNISMRAIVDLARLCEAFICMRQEEWAVWHAIRRTFLVQKGIDLQRFRPLEPPPEKLSGTPAILYYENWRGQRNPLYLCLAMQAVRRRFPEARLHLYNCPGGKMGQTFADLIHHCRWYTFIGSVKGPEADVNLLLNRADMVVSCLYPLYARGIEAFGAGKAFIGPGYRERAYPWTCDLNPDSIAQAIIACWEDYGKVNYRKWAEERHDVAETVRQSVAIYQRYLS